MVKPFQRQLRSSGTGVKIVIACEGSKTEPQYFQALGHALELGSNRLFLVPGRGSSPLSVVEAAIEKRTKLSREDPWEEEKDEVWSVFDGDEHMVNDPVRWSQCLALAQKENIKLAVCNPCIEYWFLLHYEPRNAYTTVDQAVRLLSKHIPAYDKSQSYVKNYLLARTKTAIANANRVHELGAENELSEHRNPCAHVKDLVQRIWELGSVLPPQLPPLIRENMAEYVACSPSLAGTY